MNTTREDVARRFAEAMGYFWCPATTPRMADVFNRKSDRHLMRLPRPDAPTHEKLAFVGHVAEAVPQATTLLIHRVGGRKNRCTGEALPDWWEVTFGVPGEWGDEFEEFENGHEDLCTAAMLAAIEARKG